MLFCWRCGNDWVRVGSVQILKRKQVSKSITNAVIAEGKSTHVRQSGAKPESVKPEHNQELFCTPWAFHNSHVYLSPG